VDVVFEKICAEGNINMLITNRDRELVWSSYSSAQRFQMQMEDWLYGTDRGKMQVLYSGEQYTLVRQTDDYLKSEYLVLLGSLADDGVVYMRVALESIRESADITNRFFSMVSACAIVISILVIVILSRSISQPLRTLSERSRRMSRLDFEAKYVPGKFASCEIDELGSAMNELSETLENTISELKTANNSLQQDIEKKERIDEMRKEFLSNVSHELKTPLALIQGYAEGLKECINDDEQSRDFYCDVIIDESEKMNHMVKQLLTLNQLEFGNDKVEMSRFDITELIAGVIQTQSLIAAQKKVDIRFCKDRPVYVWGDEFKVEEVITNYLTNAINHAAGECQIVIQFSFHDNVVRTSVFNTGIPIPEEDLDKIWIKFYKVDKARTREYGGSGIGLSIVKAIMDSFHQQCGVCNHEDGVEFWMELESNN
jgi:signal transduction histidine kinase